MAKIALSAAALLLSPLLCLAQSDELHLDFKGVPMWSEQSVVVKAFGLKCTAVSGESYDTLCNYASRKSETLGGKPAKETAFLFIGGRLDGVLIRLDNQYRLEIVGILDYKLGPHAGEDFKPYWMINGARVFVMNDGANLSVAYLSAEGREARNILASNAKAAASKDL